MPNPLIALGFAALVTAVVALLFWPGAGLYGRWQRARSLTTRVLREDTLKHIHKCEMEGRRPTVDSIAGALQIPPNRVAGVLEDMQESHLMMVVDGSFRLTSQGREAALHIVRAHRLWERYLADQTGFEEAEWHEKAERFEHTLPVSEVDALSARLGNPTHDPHGDPIPDAAGKFVAHGGVPLTGRTLDEPLRIVHIEDEPETVYAQLVAEGLYPGMTVRLIEASSRRIRFWANGDEHVLAPLLASNISVVPLPEAAPDVGPQVPAGTAEAEERLSALKPGQRGQVTGISPRCRGPERRRLMDLGILPGTVVAAEMASPGGDPTAYRIRDALIALREEQAQLINIARLPEAAA